MESHSELFQLIISLSIGEKRFVDAKLKEHKKLHKAYSYIYKRIVTSSISQSNEKLKNDVSQKFKTVKYEVVKARLLSYLLDWLTEYYKEDCHEFAIMDLYKKSVVASAKGLVKTGDKLLKKAVQKAIFYEEKNLLAKLYIEQIVRMSEVGKTWDKEQYISIKTDSIKKYTFTIIFRLWRRPCNRNYALNNYFLA